MSIFLTGDTHGKIQERFGVKNFPEQKELDPNDDNYVIVLGDFGLIWDTEESRQERYIINWLQEKPFTVLFVDGNHENHERLSNMEEVELFGAPAHKISESCFHLMRGEMYEITGKKFFVFGGARSNDIENLLDPASDPNWKKKRRQFNRAYEHFRVVGKSWWVGEEASEEEFAHGLKTLDSNDWKCDFVLTHTPPASLVYEYGRYRDADKTSLYLDKIRDKLQYEHWFSGHLHGESNLTAKDHLLYKQIFEFPIS